MKMLEICIALLFAYLLLNHIYRLQEGLADDPLSPKSATQTYTNQNKIKDNRLGIKKAKVAIARDLDEFANKLKKSKARSKRNRRR